MIIVIINVCVCMSKILSKQNSLSLFANRNFNVESSSLGYFFFIAFHTLNIIILIIMEKMVFEIINCFKSSLIIITIINNNNNNMATWQQKEKINLEQKKKVFFDICHHIIKQRLRRHIFQFSTHIPYFP